MTSLRLEPSGSNLAAVMGAFIAAYTLFFFVPCPQNNAPSSKLSSLWPCDHFGAKLPLVANPSGNKTPFDIWSLTHITHGIILYYVVYFFSSMLGEPTDELSLWWPLGWATTWEVFENNYPQTTSGGEVYTGDSAVNSLGDILACFLGFMLTQICMSSTMPFVKFLPLAYVALEELVLYLVDGSNIVLVIIYAIQSLSGVLPSHAPAAPTPLSSPSPVQPRSGRI